MSYLVIDVETAVAMDAATAERLEHEVQAPRNLKDPEKIKAAKAERIAKQGLRPLVAEIVCVGYAHEPYSRTIMRAKEESEENFLNRAVDHIHVTAEAIDESERGAPPAMWSWVGHNVIFDLRVLRLKCRKYRLELPIAFPQQLKPWANRIIDTMHEVDPENYESLENCAYWLLGEETYGSGAEVQERWDRGDVEDLEWIKDHCAQDVALTEQLAKALRLL